MHVRDRFVDASPSSPSETGRRKQKEQTWSLIHSALCFGRCFLLEALHLSRGFPLKRCTNFLHSKFGPRTAALARVCCVFLGIL